MDGPRLGQVAGHNESCGPLTAIHKVVITISKYPNMPDAVSIPNVWSNCFTFPAPDLTSTYQ